MKRRFGAGAVLALTLVAGLSAAPAGAQAPEAAKPTPPPVVEELAKAVDTFMDALDTADIAKFGACFAPDATMFFPLAPLYLRLENKDQIVKVFTVFFESVRRGKPGPNYMNLVAEDLKLQVYGNVAVATFHFKGTDQVSRRTLVFAHEGGKWLIVHMHASGITVLKDKQ